MKPIVFVFLQKHLKTATLKTVQLYKNYKNHRNDRGASGDDSSDSEGKKPSNAKKEVCVSSTAAENRCPKWSYKTWTTPEIYYHRQCLAFYAAASDLMPRDQTVATIAFMDGYLGKRKVRDIVSGKEKEPVIKKSRGSRVKRAAKAAIDMCYGRTFEERLEFLGQLTLHVNKQFPLHETASKMESLDECMMAIKEITKTIKIMTTRSDMKSLKQKQTLLGAIIQITEDAVTNLPFLRQVFGRQFVGKYARAIGDRKRDFVQQMPHHSAFAMMQVTWWGVLRH